MIKRQILYYKLYTKNFGFCVGDINNFTTVLEFPNKNIIDVYVIVHNRKGLLFHYIIYLNV